MKSNWPTRSGFAVILAGCIWLFGCSSLPPGMVNTGTGATKPAATVAYAWGVSAGNGDPLTILEYSTVSPNAGDVIGTLTLPSLFNGGPIASDSYGQIYVGGLNSSNQPQILIYPANSTGTAAPSRILDVSNAYEPTTLTVGPSGLLYVGTVDKSSNAAVSVYPADASGPAIPLRTIQLANNQDVLLDLAADAAGGIYTVRWLPNATSDVSTYIDIYAPDASGAAAPVRTISFSSLVYGVAVDTGGDLFANTCVTAASCGIAEFSPDANGAASPIKTIQWTNQPGGMQYWGGRVRLDSAGYIFATAGFRNPSTDARHLLYLWCGAEGHWQRNTRRANYRRDASQRIRHPLDPGTQVSVRSGF